MKRILAVIVIALLVVGCSREFITEVHPVDYVEIPVPVPGETQVITVPVAVLDTALVNRLLRGLGEIDALECVVSHEHSHREDVCGIIAITFQGLP